MKLIYNKRRFLTEVKELKQVRQKEMFYKIMIANINQRFSMDKVMELTLNSIMHIRIMKAN